MREQGDLMTTRENIIYYIITVVVFVGIIMFYSFGEKNEAEQSIAEKSAPYAAIISSVAALISAGTAIYIGTRKTRRDRVDELKVEMQELFTKDIVRQKYLEISPEEFFSFLKPEFKTREYETLHRCAYDELTYEGKNWIVNSRIKYEQGMMALANTSIPR